MKLVKSAFETTYNNATKEEKDSFDNSVELLKIECNRLKKELDILKTEFGLLKDSLVLFKNDICFFTKEIIKALFHG